MTTSSDVPALDVVYKLQEYAGLPRRKRSANKATRPAASRSGDATTPTAAGLAISFARSAVARERTERCTGEPLVRLVMRNGKRVKVGAAARGHSTALQARVRIVCRRRCSGSTPGAVYPVEVAQALRDLADEVDSRLLAQQAK